MFIKFLSPQHPAGHWKCDCHLTGHSPFSFRLLVVKQTILESKDRNRGKMRIGGKEWGWFPVPPQFRTRIVFYWYPSSTPIPIRAYMMGGTKAHWQRGWVYLKLEFHFLGMVTSLLTNTMCSKNDPELPVYSFLCLGIPASKNMIPIP